MNPFPSLSCALWPVPLQSSPVHSCHGGRRPGEHECGPEEGVLHQFASVPHPWHPPPPHLHRCAVSPPARYHVLHPPGWGPKGSIALCSTANNNALPSETHIMFWVSLFPAHMCMLTGPLLIANPYIMFQPWHRNVFFFLFILVIVIAHFCSGHNDCSPFDFQKFPSGFPCQASKLWSKK